MPQKPSTLLRAVDFISVSSSDFVPVVVGFLLTLLEILATRGSYSCRNYLKAV